MIEDEIVKEGSIIDMLISFVNGIAQKEQENIYLAKGEYKGEKDRVKRREKIGQKGGEK